MKRRLVPLLLSLLAFAAQALGQDSTVMLQAFHWNAYQGQSGNTWWVNLDGKVASIDDAQIDYVWLPPFADSADLQGYLQRRLMVLNSNYGTEAQLRTLVGHLQDAGMEVTADVILNHRVGHTGWADFVSPNWPTTYVCADDEWPGPGKGTNNDAGESLPYGRDLDHLNPAFRQSVKDWLGWVRDELDIVHWRLDNSKGYPASYASEYINAVGAEFAVGEVFDGSRSVLESWLNQANNPDAHLFDFTTRFLLRDAVLDGNYGRLASGGAPAGLLGSRPGGAVTFVENHDSDELHVDANGNPAHIPPFPRAGLQRAYAYILTHPGIPCVFYTHLFPYSGFPDNSAKIRELIAIRKAAGLHNTSAIAIQRAENGLYAAIIDNKVAVKLGGTAWTPAGSNWQLASSGDQYSVWTNTTVQPVATFNPSAAVQAGTTLQVTYNDGPGALNSPAAVSIHWGIDGWQGVVDTPMTFNSATGLWQGSVNVPVNAVSSVDIAFLNPATSQVDNNSGADWHVPVTAASQVVTAAPSPVINGQTLTVTYNDGPGALNAPGAVTMQWGTNNWQGVQQSAMTKNAQGLWQVAVTVPANAQNSVDFMFFNPANSAFDNNGGADWHVAITTAQVVTATPAPVSAGQNLTVTYNDIPGTLTAPTAVTLQWGTDGWQNSQQAVMTKNAQGLWQASVAVPITASGSVDYMFFNPVNSAFDNNGGADWHTAVAQAPVVTYSPNPVTAGQSLTVTYNDGPGVLNAPNAVTMQWGRDGWQGVQQVAMTKNAQGLWQAAITVPAAATTAVDFMFFNPNNTEYDNNAGADWHVSVQAPVTVTTLRVHYNTGFGNFIAVRGNTAPLSWTTGARASWTSGNIWVLSIQGIPAGQTFQYKCLRNDAQWEIIGGNGNRTGTGGQTIDIYPTF
jgi:alpha-amylase